MLALAGLYVATSSQVLLLVIAVTHLEMREQLLPFIRFDGYYIRPTWSACRTYSPASFPSCAAPWPRGTGTRV